MSAFQFKAKALVTAVAMTASVCAYAGQITVTSFSNVKTWIETSPGTLTKQTPADNSAVTAALYGNGNVELGKFGGLQVLTPGSSFGTLTGTDGSHTVTLSSLQKSDWTGPNNTNVLAKRYIQDTATHAFQSPLNDTELAQAVTAFLSLDLNPHPIFIFEPWQYVSDPNISKVYLSGTNVKLDLAGFYNAAPIIGKVFAGVIGFDPNDVPDFLQMSEVVKAQVDNSDPVYLYGFSATRSGVSTADGSYDGNYHIPEPASLALLSVGLFGLLATRRRRA